MNGHSEKAEMSNLTMANPLPTLEVTKRPNGVKHESYRESYSESHNETQITRRK